MTHSSYIILACIGQQPTTGYDIKIRWHARYQHIYGSAAKSQIYGELRRCETLGLLKGLKVKQTLRPDKIVYTMTPKGHAVLASWLALPSSELDVCKSADVLAVALGADIPPEALHARLLSRKAWLECQIREVQDLLTIEAATPQASPHYVLTIQRSLLLWSTDCEWIDAVLTRLADDTPPFGKAKTTRIAAPLPEKPVRARRAAKVAI